MVDRTEGEKKEGITVFKVINEINEFLQNHQVLKDVGAFGFYFYLVLNRLFKIFKE